jgi:hypothetical protein
MKKTIPPELEKIFNREMVRANLISASLYLLAYEILKYAIVDRSKSFLSSGTAAETKEYKAARSLHEYELQAFCLWLKDSGAIDEQDIIAIQAIRKQRNDLAHYLTEHLLDTGPAIGVNDLALVLQVVRKIELWWLKEVEIPSNSDYDGNTFADEDLQSGTTTVLDYLLETATAATANRSQEFSR